MDKFTILKEYFGHDSFRNGQADIIDNILSGRDVLGIMPTGAGKSVCYQVPALLMNGITLVISPLISLMKDQVSALIQSGIKAAYINSSLTFAQYREAMRRAYLGAYKIIYVAPERLEANEFIEFAEKMKISMITIDEAHCISQWGQDFRPSYRKIIEFIEKLSYRPIISAFTATATADVRDDIIRLLGLDNPFLLTTGFDRKNLYFGVMKPKNKYNALKELLAEHPGKCGIVYCISRKNVEEVCRKLNCDGFSATRYHAGLSDEERFINQDDFIYDRKSVMVATNAFGMGIDKSNVSFVIHYNMPKNLESYYQEAGRAGRDGSNADCIILYSGNDVRTNNFLIENGNDTDNGLSDEERAVVIKKDKERLKSMTYYCMADTCLREYILRYFGENSSNFCGNCSSCLYGFETVDITIDAQKIVSCVYRIHQKGPYYGKTMITDILRGKINERITTLGLDKLSTYGIMKDVTITRIRSMIDFLIREEYLMTEEEFNTVRLTARSAEILHDRKNISMRLPKETDSEKKRNTEEAYYENSTLFQMLKKLRNQIASAAHVPAYIVFTDASLKDMCRLLPVDYNMFLNVSGVGKAKADKYSKSFCSLIKDYLSSNPEHQNAPEGNVSYLEAQLDSFRQHAVRGGEKSMLSPPWSKKEDEQLISEIKNGMNMEEISKLHNRSISAISSRIRKFNSK